MSEDFLLFFLAIPAFAFVVLVITAVIISAMTRRQFGTTYKTLRGGTHSNLITQNSPLATRFIVIERQSIALINSTAEYANGARQ